MRRTAPAYTRRWPPRCSTTGSTWAMPRRGPWVLRPWCLACSRHSRKKSRRWRRPRRAGRSSTCGVRVKKARRFAGPLLFGRRKCLPLRDQVKKVEELREADGCRFRTLDQRFAIGFERGYAEGHGDAMIAAGIDGGAMKRLATAHVEPVLALDRFG